MCLDVLCSSSSSNYRLLRIDVSFGVDILAALLALQHRLDLGVEARATLLGLPGGHRALSEQQLNLLDCLSAGLGVREEGLDGRADTQHAEDDEDVSLDVEERRRREHAQGKVEEPVSHGGQRHTGRARPQRPYLSCVDPSHRR